MLGKILKTIVKTLLWILLGILGLLFVVAVLLYVPPVQRVITSKVSALASSQTDFDISMGSLRMRFPLKFTIDELSVRDSLKQEILVTERINVKVAFMPLLRGKIKIGEFEIKDASVNYSDSLDTAHLYGTLDLLSVKGAEVGLRQNSVDIRKIVLEGVDLRMDLSPDDTDKPRDTTDMAWKFSIGDVIFKQIKFAMTLPLSIDSLGVDIGLADIDRLSVDLGGQTVDFKNFEINRGFYSLIMPKRTRSGEEMSDDDSPGKPWTIKGERFALRDNSIGYEVKGEPRVSGLDPNYIHLSGIDLTMDSVYNRGGDIAAHLRSLSLTESNTGLRINSASGRFSMDSLGLSLNDFELITPNSLVTADATADAAIFNGDPQAKLEVDIDGTIGWRDLTVVLNLTSQQRSDLSGRNLVVELHGRGSLAAFEIERLNAALNNNVFLSASGRVFDITSASLRRGDIMFNANLAGADFLKSFISNPNLRSRIGFPDRIDLNGNFAFTGSSYRPTLTLGIDGGYVRLQGMVDTSTEIYDVDMQIHHLPLFKLLPKDSLGYLTLALDATGAGFNPAAQGAKSNIALLVSEFAYKGYNYDTLSVKGSLANSLMNVDIDSRSAAADFMVHIDGVINPCYISADIKSRIDNLDFNKLRLQDEAMAFSVEDVEMDFSASTGKEDNYSVNMRLSEMKFRVGELSDRIYNAVLVADIGEEGVNLSLSSEDMSFAFSADEAIDRLIGNITAAANIFKSQVDSLRFDMAPVYAKLPDFNMTLSAGDSNAASRIAAKQGLKFKRLDISAVSSDTDSLRLRGELNEFNSSGLTLDTLRFGLRGKGHKAEAFVRMANREGNIDELGLLYLFARVEDNDLTVSLLQRDRDRNTGLNMRFNSEFSDDSIKVRLNPDNLIIASEAWSVNADNYVVYKFDHQVLSNLKLNGPSKHIYLTSIDENSDATPDKLNVDMSGISIGKILGVLPNMPPLDGMISTNLNLGYQYETLTANGTLNIDSISYAGRSPGDIAMIFRYRLDSASTHLAGMRLDVNDKEAVNIGAEISMTDKGRRAHMTVNVPDFPLDLVNMFLPADTVSIRGALHGTMDAVVEGRETILNGQVSFSDAGISSPLTGTSFTLAADTINIVRNRLLFDNYRVYSGNGQSLHLVGNIDLGDFSNPVADMRIMARNFQAINTSRTRGSVIYGRANLDIGITAAGPLDALTIRGGAHLLSGTDIGFTPQRSFAVRDTRQNVVRFVSFAEEDSRMDADSLPRLRTRGMDILLTLQIDDDVRTTLNMSSTGSDRLELQGGGTLTYTMNSQGDSRFSGRYTVSGGRVIYNPPLIQQKNFVINDGGYVEWTGDMLNPMFNITASETIRANVIESDDTSRLVDFVVTLSINNSLEDMNMAFDLSAPSDIAIQSQLASLDAEQRFSQALMLLINNTYTGPGTTASNINVGVNNSLNAFVENELNNWARNNLSGVELSFGINSAVDGATDYSYQVSKRFWDDRITVSVGGSISSDQDATSNAQNNLIGDVTVEYRLTKRDNMYLKAFRITTNDMLEGEVTKTGFGFMVRRRMNKLYELFRISTERQMRRNIDKLREQHLGTEAPAITPDGKQEANE